MCKPPFWVVQQSPGVPQKSPEAPQVSPVVPRVSPRIPRDPARYHGVSPRSRGDSFGIPGTLWVPPLVPQSYDLPLGFASLGGGERSGVDPSGVGGAAL